MGSKLVESFEARFSTVMSLYCASALDPDQWVGATKCLSLVYSNCMDITICDGGFSGFTTPPPTVPYSIVFSFPVPGCLHVHFVMSVFSRKHLAVYLHTFVSLCALPVHEPGVCALNHMICNQW
uniref:Uncharacterized protein n=1 Tax=Anguilla anguilla TaxID=7936 RepID=A0A0E9X367_ANGAN